MEWDKQTVTMIVILIICVFGLVGNSLCGIVILAKSPKTPFYLLLIGLTFCDTLLLIKNLPNVLHHLQVLSLNNSPRWLEITFYLADWISFSGTKYFTVAVSLERYFIICHTMRAQRSITHRRAVAFAISVMVFVVLISIWSFVYQNHIDNKRFFQIYKAMILHVIPLILIIILNVLLCLGLRRFQNQHRKLTSTDAKEISVTKMLLAVVAVFTVCSGVEFVRNILAFSGYFDYGKYKWYDYNINCLSGILVAFNSAINFIIYCLMGATFLAEFKERMAIISNSLKSWICFSCRASDGVRDATKIIDDSLTKESSLSHSHSEA